MPADRQRRHPTRGQPHHREQPLPAGKLQVHRRGTPVEPPFFRRRPGSEHPHQIGQFLIRGGDRCDLRAASVVVLDEDPVEPVGVDGLHRRVVQQRLQTRHAEHFVDDFGDRLLLDVFGDEHAVGHQLGFAVGAHRLVEDGSRQLAASLAGHRCAGASLLGIRGIG